MSRDRDRRIEREVPALRRYARALLRDPDRADDLVQDCLERALGRWHLWQSERALRPWLFAILHNCAVDARRREVRRPPEASLDSVAPSALAVPPAQLDRLAADEVLQAVGRLPQEQREVLLLVAVEGFGYREAAGVLGIPVGTVMSRLSRARERLSAMLGEAREATIRRVK